ncbi:ferredoxin reductase family protein [Serinibacter salmoneus]|uniref:Putative ferric reductase n=1 Tax=Serinibacter salmoneus TaxID=556530 RepID=A0A2A9D3J5_9MICO|nr:ferredoxin reductase family protein [Serinibacter salmoneus]PFG21288.1 putative ferric reductase [Serinibacter salmoneus]
MATSLAPPPHPDAAGQLSPPPVPPADNRARTWWNLAAITTIWVTSLGVVAVWVAGGGVQDLLVGGNQSLRTLGRITGLVSANLLLYQVLLMARIPLFERGFGRDALLRGHRLIGMWSFTLMMAHIVLLVLGYALPVGMNPFVQLWDMIWTYPGMLLATAGTALIILVMITSARRARRRLRYESWHLLHLYAYLGVGLAVPHMLWTGGDFLLSPVATAYWWTLWALAFASVLVFRVAVPLLRSWRHRVRVTHVEPDGVGGVRVRMKGRRMRALRVRAGQFFVFRFRSGPGWTRGHPYSVASAPGGNTMEIAVRRIGDGTHALADMPVGTRVLLEGPYGGMTGELRTGRRLLMIGAGAGITPLIALLGEQPYAPGEAVLLVRDHDPAASLGLGDIARLQRERGLVHVPLPGPRARGESGWMPRTHEAWDGPTLLRYLAPGLDRPGEWDVYLCGPDPWMASLTRDLVAAGLPREALHSESFSI